MKKNYKKNFNIEGVQPLYDDLFEQAKEMEKQQIIEAYANGHNDGCLYMNNEKQTFEHAEQYYNETFKNK